MRAILSIVSILILLSRAQASSIEKISEFQKQGIMTDVVLISSDEVRFFGHRVVLASYSPYFEKMFTGGMRESFAYEIALPYSSKALEIILDFIYERRTSLTGSMLIDVFFELRDFCEQAFAQGLKNALRLVELTIGHKESAFDRIINGQDDHAMDQIFYPKGHVEKRSKRIRLLDGPRAISGAFSPDGARVVSACHDFTAKILDADNGKKLLSLKHDRSLASASFGPDGARVVTASDKTAKIWDAITGIELLSLRHDLDVTSASFNPDGTRVVTTSLDGTAKIWNAENGTLLSTLPSRKGWTYWSASFSPDGSRLAIPSSSGEGIAIWDAFRGVLLFELRSEAPLYFPLFSPDGTRLAGSSSDITMIWDASTGMRLLSIDNMRLKSFSPDGAVFLGYSSLQVVIIDSFTGSSLLQLPRYDSYIMPYSFSPDGARVLLSNGHRLEIWNLPPKELYVDKALLSSEHAPSWLWLKYTLHRYLNRNEQPSYEIFIRDAFDGDPEISKEARDLIANNESLSRYLRSLFEDFSL